MGLGVGYRRIGGDHGGKSYGGDGCNDCSGCGGSGCDWTHR